MSDSSAFIAGCATTGAAALMLLLARMSIDGSSTALMDPGSAPTVDSLAPVPAPPPPSFQVPDAQEPGDLEQELEEQQELTTRLENQLQNQQRIISELENKIQEQQQESKMLSDRLEDYRVATTNLTDRQVRLEGEQQDVGQTQNSLVWVGAGLLLVLLTGGGGILILMALWMSQNLKNNHTTPSNTVIYSPPVAPTPYHYYDYEQGYGPEMLPPTPLRPASVQQSYPQHYR